MKTHSLVFAIIGLVALAALAAVFAWNRRNPPEVRELVSKADRGMPFLNWNWVSSTKGAQIAYLRTNPSLSVGI